MTNIFSTAIEKLLFHPVTITDVETLGRAFQLVSLHGEGLHDVTWIPGQTTQFYIGSFTKRAYTPMDLDSKAGSARFLFYLHGHGPGSAWAASLKRGDVCKVMRPKRSIDFTKAGSSVLFFGDETSFAAAQALQQCRHQETPHHFVFEVTSTEASSLATSRLGLDGVVLVEKRNNASHLDEVAQTLKQQASTLSSPEWFFTGQALSIQGVRKRLRADRISLDQSVVKPYWSPGKTGMD
jgi:NADPH-dependent ferric siderophore reductase